MEQLQEKLLEIHREFSTITAEDLLECGIKNFAEYVGYDMTYDGVNIIKTNYENGKLLFTICDGEIAIKYDKEDKVSVKDANYSLAYNGRKFFKC